jgi:F-type H+-transporting ATPase subunit alpha
VKEFQTRLTEFLSTRKAELLQKIASEKKITPELSAELKLANDLCKETWK